MASADLTDRDVTAVKNLIQRSSLRTIEFHEVSGRLIPAEGDIPETEPANVSIRLEHRVDKTSFGVRMVGTVSNTTKEVRVAVAAEYDMTDGTTPEERTVLLFGNEVAVMSLFPYFREGVSSISAKVFNDPLLLPTIERGMIGFEIADEA